MTHDGTISSILHIQSLKLKVNIGLTEKERAVAQVLVIDIKIAFKTLPKLAITDDIKDGYCYAEIIQLVRTYTKGKQFKLIEHLAWELNKLLKARIIGHHITVMITKKPKVVGFTGNICFECDKNC